MVIFFNILGLNLLILLTCALIGGGIILPFRHSLTYPIFATPLAGLLIWVLGISALYSFAGISVQHAAIIVAVSAIIFTIAYLVYLHIKFPWQSIALFGIGIILTGFLSYIINITAIQMGAAGFLYMDGSDQLGYVQTADWLREHLLATPPNLSPSVPYQAWTASLYFFDSRFGSFFLISLISWIMGQPGIFAFDNVCAIVLIASYLGIAAVYARSIPTFILILAGLICCSWFEYSRSGYFGKIIGYPSAMFILGLFLTNYKPFNYLKLIGLTILTCAAAMVYPGTITVFMMLFFCSLYFLIQFILSRFDYKKIRDELQGGMVVLALIVMMALATTGGFSRPAFGFTQYPHVYFAWEQLLPAFIDIQSLVHDGIFNLFNDQKFIYYLSLLSLLGAGFLLIKAVLVRSTHGMVLIGGPLLLLAILMILNAQTTTYQLIGIFYPLSLCGFAWLLDDMYIKTKVSFKKSHLIVISIALIMLMVSLRVPKYLEALHRYAGPGIFSTLQYSKDNFNKLAGKIGSNLVTINLPAGSINYALPVLIEFGRQGLSLQWTAQTWKIILGYKDWPPPKLQPTQFILMLNPKAATALNLKIIKPEKDCIIQYEDRTYQLWQCKFSK